MEVKERNLFNRIMHFLVHNGFLFTVIVMCLVHASLLLIMILAKVTPLIQFNVLSVIVYLFCIMLCKFGHIMPVYISIILEVSIYTVFSTYHIGLNKGSYCFLFSIVPIILYFGSFLFKGAKRWFVALMLILNFSLYVVLYIMFSHAKPTYEFTPLFEGISVIFSTFVMVFSVFFYNTLYIYSSEYEKTDLELLNKQLSADAKEDVLTNLLNRRGFLPLVKECINDKKANHFCIAFCDIDNFKRINDSYGHDGGDEVLRHITQLIKREMHGCEICRWGGEEIVILMKDYDMEVAKEKMEYLRKCIESNPTIFYNRRIVATITIGLEENSESYHDAEEIIKTADERMYMGKQHGKNIVVYEEEIHEDQSE
ncbi:MAG: GGDEF domain-containing protein [Lachnospiraceae bacterium]|nr:GGDEF domain-containing protein [Lachnospiraceae bacterium]